VIGLRIRYVSVVAPQLTFRVEVVAPNGNLAVGHVVPAENGRWTAHPRNKPRHKAQGGFYRRADAATFCAIESGAGRPTDWREAAWWQRATTPPTTGSCS
jgi:hypothetical protein